MPSRRLTMTFMLAGCVLTIAACGGASSDDQTEPQAAAKPESSLLFVQSARCARASEDRIVLADAAAGTLAFSDRPVRRAGTIPTARFTAGFRRAFADDAPNAAVSVADDRSAYVVELSTPRFNQAQGTLSYAITRVPGSARLPARIGPLNLFIDSGVDLFGRLATRLVGSDPGLVRPAIPSRFESP